MLECRSVDTFIFGRRLAGLRYSRTRRRGAIVSKPLAVPTRQAVTDRSDALLAGTIAELRIEGFSNLTQQVFVDHMLRAVLANDSKPAATK